MSLQARQPVNRQYPDREATVEAAEVDPAFVEELIKVGFKITKLARARGRSLRQFERKFSQQFQRCPRQVILAIRMEVAYERLFSDAPLKQIAAYLGYYDAAHFCHAFRDHFGVSPLQMRRELSRSFGEALSVSPLYNKMAGFYKTPCFPNHGDCQKVSTRRTTVAGDESLGIPVSVEITNTAKRSNAP
jgi:AraC-like DNA-binding protein